MRKGTSMASRRYVARGGLSMGSSGSASRGRRTRCERFAMRWRRRFHRAQAASRDARCGAPVAPEKARMAETRKEAIDREFKELLEELRVIVPGVQLLA